MRRNNLAMQILIGLLLGIGIGAIFYGNPIIIKFLQPVGDIFIRLIKMIVIPIVISSVVIGISGMGDTKKIGKLGFKTIVYFEIITILAIIVGLIFANILQPGVGVNLDSLAKTDISKYVDTTKEVASHSFVDTFVHIVPVNIIDSLAKGDILAVIFFSIFLGLGVTAIGEKGKPLIHFFHSVSETMFWITNQVMRVAPIGVFALIGVTVSKFGIHSLIPLGKLIFSVYGTLLFFVIVIFGFIAKLIGVSIFKIIKTCKDEISLAFSASSSETVLPKVIEKSEKLGCPKSIVSFVIPIGYTFNLDGSTLYQSLAALFIAQMYNIHLSIVEQITLVLVLAITSKGIAGVSGTSLVVLLTTLGAFGIPIEGLAFIAGIDRLLDMGRTAVNVIGYFLSVLVISKWEGQFDKEKYNNFIGSINTEEKDIVRTL